jgi:riboflavin synthase
MFSGIVESTGVVKKIQHQYTNIQFTIECPFTSELKIDQSIAHNGVCLTVVAIENNEYTVTAIDETLQRSNLRHWQIGTPVNLERCLRVGDRLDGHIVQGHVDITALCTSVQDLNGSWKYTFDYSPSKELVTVAKGSICINGVSLTVVDSSLNSFSVCIIPYTYEHTNFKQLKAGDLVNLEFDIVGKYIARLMLARV